MTAKKEDKTLIDITTQWAAERELGTSLYVLDIVLRKHGIMLGGSYVREKEKTFSLEPTKYLTKESDAAPFSYTIPSPEPKPEGDKY